MLTLSSDQFATFDNQAEQGFRQQLLAYVLQECPGYAEVSPITLNRLIGHGLARARRYGFTFQSTLGQFIGLMASIAPDFDGHPAIHALLVNPAIPVEERIARLAERLPAGVWQQAAERGSNIGWFLTEDGFGLGRAGRIARAVTQVLPDAAPFAGIEKAIADADARGWHGEDQQFVYTVCAAHYGLGFAAEQPWAQELFAGDLNPPLQAALLRVRIALDAGVWV